MSLRFIESKHLTLFINPDDLRKVADALDRKRKRREDTRNKIVRHGPEPTDEDYYLEEMKTLSVAGGGLHVWFRLPEEETSSMEFLPCDTNASEGGTPGCIR